MLELCFSLDVQVKIDMSDCSGREGILHPTEIAVMLQRKSRFRNSHIQTSEYWSKR